jgi:hypothetical protein
VTPAGLVEEVADTAMAGGDIGKKERELAGEALSVTPAGSYYTPAVVSRCPRRRAAFSSSAGSSVGIANTACPHADV